MKGDKTHKVRELFQDIATGLEFRLDVAKIRSNFDIPPEGFPTFEEMDRWYVVVANKRPRPKKTYDDCLEWLQTKYKIPVVTTGLIHFFVSMNKILPFTDDEVFDVCEFDRATYSIDGESPILKSWQRNGRPFISLYISDIASKDDVIHYLNREWEAIKSHLQNIPSAVAFRNQDWNFFEKKDASINKFVELKKKRIKVSRHRSRDEKVYFLSLMSRELLGAKKGEYKNQAIKRKLEENGVNLNTDNIRQIISRQKKLRHM